MGRTPCPIVTKLRLKPTSKSARLRRSFVTRSAAALAAAAKPGLHGENDTFVHIQAVQARLAQRMSLAPGRRQPLQVLANCRGVIRIDNQRFGSTASKWMDEVIWNSTVADMDLDAVAAAGDVAWVAVKQAYPGHARLSCANRLQDVGELAGDPCPQLGTGARHEREVLEVLERPARIDEGP